MSVDGMDAGATGSHPRDSGVPSSSEPAWLHGHAHEPNPVVPAGDGRFRLVDGAEITELTIESLRALPQQTLDECTIYSTGHDASGPFRFGGVAVRDLISARAPGGLAGVVAVDVVSVDDFGTRLLPDDLNSPHEPPPLLAWQIDGAPMSRAQGLVRLIVPSERDDALRQVKWVAQVVVHRNRDARP